MHVFIKLFNVYLIVCHLTKKYIGFVPILYGKSWHGLCSFVCTSHRKLCPVVKPHGLQTRTVMIACSNLARNLTPLKTLQICISFSSSHQKHIAIYFYFLLSVYFVYLRMNINLVGLRVFSNTCLRRLHTAFTASFYSP